MTAKELHPLRSFIGLTDQDSDSMTPPRASLRPQMAGPQMAAPHRFVQDAVTKAGPPGREPMVLVSQRDLSRLGRQRRRLLQTRKRSELNLSSLRQINGLLGFEILEAWGLCAMFRDLALKTLSTNADHMYPSQSS
ncbi:uncharacterized protein N7484_006079 [Penicillium longicatenatum]|uniref:uncharacterized protein n=1 Tax=Penicillium longicatenatum TaxID=1561947 RepID=UPI0025487703|nr:uncharacterized protein N7484_006079 [Penicillium longicatenatum]KAJ5643572.1 hypothetical protein N7484_006079 [Penicillium longicatenatum]